MGEVGSLSAGAVGSGAQFLWLLEVRENVSLEGAHYDESTHLSCEDVEVDKRRPPAHSRLG